MISRFSKIIKFPAVSRSIFQSAVRMKEEDSVKDIRGSVGTKFQVFRNETGIIFDIEEERKRENEESDELQELPSSFAGLNLERGVAGVFDIEDLVDVLKKENAKNLCVIKFPKELKYVDHLCIGRPPFDIEGISYRHMVGIADFVKKMYKMKRQTGDIIPKLEGEKCRNWIAMDLGNIALHIFARKTREYYDLESLWCLGEEYEKRVKNRNIKEEIYQSYLNAAIASTAVDHD